MLESLISKEHWKKARKANLEAARRCLHVLTDPNGHWKYQPDSKEVRQAVGTWVKRARRAHAIVMGREPVIEHFATLTRGGMKEGPVYLGDKLVTETMVKLGMMRLNTARPTNVSTLVNRLEA